MIWKWNDTASDESGDARVFTQALAERYAQRGVEFLCGHDVLRLNKQGNAIISVAACAVDTLASGLNNAQKGLKKDIGVTADSFVMAYGSCIPPLLQPMAADKHRCRFAPSKALMWITLDVGGLKAANNRPFQHKSKHLQEKHRARCPAIDST